MIFLVIWQDRNDFKSKNMLACHTKYRENMNCFVISSLCTQDAGTEMKDKF